MAGVGASMTLKFAHSELSVKQIVRCQRDDFQGAATHPANMDAQWHLRAWRKRAGLSQEALAERAETSKGYLSDLESGKRPVPPGRLVERIASALGVQPADLFRDPNESSVPDPFVPVIGLVGADAEGSVLFSDGQGTGDEVPIPPGGTVKARALLVKGHSMSGFADDGALIYFEDQRTPPTPDMLRQPCVVETADGRVLVKKLLKGSGPGVYDLESLNGPLLEDQRLNWAAEITAVIPPRQAARVMRPAGMRQPG